MKLEWRNFAGCFTGLFPSVFRDGKDRRILIFSNKTFMENLLPLILRSLIPSDRLCGAKVVNPLFQYNYGAAQSSSSSKRKNRQYLDFERPIKELFDEIEKLKQTAEKTKVDLSDSIRKLEDQVIEKRREITQHLTPWQKVQLSRHPDRPYTLKYPSIRCVPISSGELFGDRNVKGLDIKAMVKTEWFCPMVDGRDHDDDRVSRRGSIPRCASSGTSGWPTPKDTARRSG